MSRVKIAVAGAGSRGNSYSNYALQHDDQVEIVGVAEPREYYRNQMAEKFNIPKTNIFTSWQEMAEKKQFADAIIVATQDNMHVEPAIAFANKGYNMLLEKPMAPNEQGCRDIYSVVSHLDMIFAVCHLRRYTVYTEKLKQIIDSGKIGEIISIQLLEPVGYFHQAHSYVRGNWANEGQSSPMLLAKSCHDLDWIRYLIGQRCTKISSFGNLKHFRKENKPSEAGECKRCLSCQFEAKCPYSAKKIYLDAFDNGERDWPINIITTEFTREAVKDALDNGPYGRCVYECDNDVVDHQVVNMLFEGGQTASFTMTAFNEGGGRKIRIFGTRGEIYGDDKSISVFDFLSDTTQTFKIQFNPGIVAGHGGGDYLIMKNFVEALRKKDAHIIKSGILETLETHLMVFAAEKSRRESCVVEL